MTDKETRRPEVGGRSTVLGMKGAVSCEHPLAALAGIRVLDEGGNAADACVAMAACMAVLAPMTTGMGGDAFLLFYDAGARRVLGANGSGRAPRGATVEKLRERGIKEMPKHGGVPVTVPGAVRLWEDAANRFGRLDDFSRLLEPARQTAEEGYPVSEVVSRYWKIDEALLRENETTRRTLLPRGRAPVPGEPFRQPDLARTITTVAEEGADAFYHGEIARKIVHAAQRTGGYLDEEDLARHETLWVDPIHTDYRGTRVHEIPPPAQGIATLEMLNILEGFDLGGLDALSAERIHLEVEAKKLAFRDLHEKIGDPELVDVPTRELLSREYAAKLRESISFDRVIEPVGSVLGSDTTYLCAVDAEGNACSFINSLFMRFGSGIVADDTGVCLHNRGHSFSLVEDHPNTLLPGKRPLHTIIPALATREGDLWAVFGVMGRFMQPQGHVQLLSNLIDHGMSPQEAVDHPRHFHDEGVLLVESRVPANQVRKLREMGHRVRVGEEYEIPTGGAQLIRVFESGVRACGSDPRKDGCALAQ